MKHKVGELRWNRLILFASVAQEIFMTRFSPLPALCLLAILAAPCTSQAESNSDRVQFGRDIRVESGERAGEVAESAKLVRSVYGWTDPTGGCL